MTDDDAAGADPESQRQEADALTRALVGLIELEGPVAKAAATVKAAIDYCGTWLVRSERLVALRRDHVRALIQALLVEEISEDDVRLWARTLIGRVAWIKSSAETTRPLILLERNYQVPIRMVLGSMAAAEDDPRWNYAGTLMSLETEGLARMIALLDCENPTGPDDLGPVDQDKAVKLLRAWEPPKQHWSWKLEP